MREENTPPPTSTQDRRNTERQPMEATVTIRFTTQEVVGPGQNVSGEGAFFVAETSLPVEIRVQDEDDWRPGEVVRLQSMGAGKVGIAVKFV